MKDGVPMATIEMKMKEWQQVCGDAMSGGKGGMGKGNMTEPTPLMFYYTGFEAEGMDPQPIWFHTDASMTPANCEFSIGEPWAQSGTRARGRCEMDTYDGPPSAVMMVFDNMPDQPMWLKVTDNFGAGDMEPEAKMKWSDGNMLYVWMMTDEDMMNMWGGMDGNKSGGGDAVNHMLHVASDWIWKNAGDAAKNGEMVQWN